MKRYFKVVVSKTVQERQYEPYNIKFESEFEPPENLTQTELTEFIDKEYAAVENRVDAWINRRLIGTKTGVNINNGENN